MHVMKTIEVKDNQTLLDIALQHYGTAEGISEILSDNPSLRNDPRALAEEGRDMGSFHPDIKLYPGSMLSINDESRTVRKTVIKKIDHSVTTYMTEEWQELLNR